MTATDAVTNEAARETVVPLELFFDLVIVFAFTQAAGLMSADPRWTGLARGLLLLSALWWLWTGYARLTNAVDPEAGGVRVVMLGAIAATLIVSLAAPSAFGRDAIIFAIAYGVARALHVVLSAVAARNDGGLQRDTIRLVPNAFVATALLVAAGLLDGPAQISCWIVLALVSYLGVLPGGGRGWQVSPRHFVERFGQIILIALGESVVAIGFGAQGHQLDATLITAALLGITVVACLWWAYFDWVVYVAQARLAAAPPNERARLARDGYAYLHSPMVAGIILFAFGLQTALQQPHEMLQLVAATALAGGVALYLIAHVALRLRLGGGLGRGRPIAALLLLASIPVYNVTSAIVVLGVTATVCVGLIAYEVVRHREPRALIRSRRGTLEAADISALARPE